MHFLTEKNAKTYRNSLITLLTVCKTCIQSSHEYNLIYIKYEDIGSLKDVYFTGYYLAGIGETALRIKYTIIARNK